MTEVGERLWHDILQNVRLPAEAGTPTWLPQLEIGELAGGQLEVMAPDETKRQWLNRFARAAFTEAAQLATGMLVSVQFRCSRTPPPAPVRAGAVYPSPPAGGAAGGVGPQHAVQLNPEYRFETFVVGPCNRLAHAASQAVAEKPGHAYNPLFLHGGVGLGKTHLLQATCAQLLAHEPELVIVYVACEEFVNQFIQAVQAGDLDRFRGRYRTVDVLVIDDVHFLADKERTQEEFFHTFNTLYQQKRQIILSSDSPPSEVPKLEQRLMSRFASGLVARLDPPTFETRVAIIHKKAEMKGLEIPQDVVNYIAERIQSSPRELEGAITTLMGLAMLNHGEITYRTAVQALGDGRGPTARPIGIPDVLDAVVRRFDVRVSDLQGKRRPKSIAWPRQICMHLARELTDLSLEEIGGYFGGRDHTTVLHADRQIRLQRSKDAKLESLIQSLIQELSQG